MSEYVATVLHTPFGHKDEKIMWEPFEAESDEQAQEWAKEWCDRAKFKLTGVYRKIPDAPKHVEFDPQSPGIH